MLNQTRTRKDIRALKPAERERFFYCLKMLMILPPQEQSNFRVFNVVWSQQDGFSSYKPVTPLNIHDQFISSHQTSCEHGEPYFAYYHRHLMICVEIALNYAEEVLIAGKDKLPRQFYESNAREFDAVFLKYRDIIRRFRDQYKISGQKLPTVSLHYWNPVDYTQVIAVPQEIRQRTPDEMDRLCFKVHQHYPWNFNFATRWFKETGFIPQGFDTNGYFQGQPAYYTQQQRKIMLGQMNPRSDPDNFFSNSIDRYGTMLIGDKASEVNAYKNYRSLVATRSTIDLCTLDQNEMDTLFGSQKKQLHWISRDERNKMSSSSRTRSYAYNKGLPHFQYAYALYKEPNTFFRNYISTFDQNYENSLQNCHNTMHNNLQRFMSDAQLSITNPLFFLYHSWIDLALETKIRMVRAGPNSLFQYQRARSYLANVKPYSILNQVVAKDQQITLGQYPIFEWVIPITRIRDTGVNIGPKDYQAAFPGQDYLINPQKQGIRRSDELHQFYQKNYLPQHGARYRYFSGFKEFDYNYNYDIMDYNSDGKPVFEVMEGNKVLVPSYIRAIYNDYVHQWNNNKIRNIAATQNSLMELRTSKKFGEAVGNNGNQNTSIVLNSSPPTMNINSMPVISNQSLEQQPPSLQTSNPPPINPPEPLLQMSQEDYYNQKDLLKAIRQTFAGYATYSSKIKSIVISIVLELTEEGEKEIKLSKQQAAIMKEGLIISIIPLFTKGSGALVCPNCKAEKTLLIECTENLAEMNEQLFCALARSLNREIIFKIQNGDIVELYRPHLKQLVRLVTPKPIFNKLVMLQGANEMSFNVTFKGKEDYKTSSIRINGYSYSIQTEKLSTIVSRSTFKLNCSVDMPVLVGIADTENGQSHFLYRRVKVLIINGPQELEFQYDIVTFHKLIRYQIEIVQKKGQRGNYLDVTVKDMDYEFKQTHYSMNQYEL